MSRIAARFETLRRSGRKGFIPFVTAGDPSLEESLQVCLKLADLGADVIELGVPFSDPMADGPTIQRSSQRALENGATLSAVLDLAREFRARSEVPVVLFSYLNPLIAMGFDSFASASNSAGIDGVLITDAIDAEAAELGDRLRRHEMDLISLVAPTTTDERLEKICSYARGFIYAVSRAGVTGAQENVSSSAESLVSRTRKFTDLPIAVGFGISTAVQVADVWRFADAAVVGSAIVSEIENNAGQPAAAVERFVKRLLPSVANAKG